mmetsp:Transcript_55715/g.129763  ORF Transcript_55715/g.129763 Transcript_55715/m.129763 type:complete len:251 (+) Transcript_55715:50-802(+)
MPPPTLPIASRRELEQPSRESRGSLVKKFFAPLLPIHSKTTRSVSLAPPSEAEASGGVTRRASCSEAVPNIMVAAAPSPASCRSSPCFSAAPMVPGSRVTRVHFAASPTSVKEYTPHDPQMSPWASPTALSPKAAHSSDDTNSCGSVSPVPMLPAAALQSALLPGLHGAAEVRTLTNQLVVPAGQPSAVMWGAGRAQLPMAATQQYAVQAPQTITYVVPSAGTAAAPLVTAPCPLQYHYTNGFAGPAHRP